MVCAGTCEKCGKGQMQYIMLIPVGYFECNACGHKYIPKDIKTPIDGSLIQRCIKCDEPIKRLMFTFDDDEQSANKYLECPKCQYRVEIDDEQMAEIAKRMGIEGDMCAYQFVSQTVGQFLLGPAKREVV